MRGGGWGGGGGGGGGEAWLTWQSLAGYSALPGLYLQCAAVFYKECDQRKSIALQSALTTMELPISYLQLVGVFINPRPPILVEYLHPNTYHFGASQDQPIIWESSIPVLADNP